MGRWNSMDIMADTFYSMDRFFVVTAFSAISGVFIFFGRREHRFTLSAAPSLGVEWLVKMDVRDVWKEI